jgi:hypothetical protein
MRLKLNAMTAVVVRKSWANLEAIRTFLRGRTLDCTFDSRSDGKPDGKSNGTSDENQDDSCTILARVVDDSHERGLWIELDTEKELKDAGTERPALMIPWREVLAVVVAQNLVAQNLVAKDLAGKSSAAKELSPSRKDLEELERSLTIL